MPTPKPIIPTDPGAGVPAPIRAAAIAYRLLSSTKVATWSELARTPEQCRRIQLTPEQETLLNDQLWIVQWVRTNPKRVPWMCDTCGQIGFFGKDRNPPSSCTLTEGCHGSPIRTPLGRTLAPPRRS